MNYPKMSTNGLKALHDAIANVLKKDEALPAGQDKIYGAREFPDWKEASDQIESELDARNEPFTKIPW